MMETKKRQESLLSHLFDLALMQLNPIWGFDQMAIIGGIEAGGTKFICIMYDTVNESILCGTVVKTTKAQETINIIFVWFDLMERNFGKLDSIGVGIFGPLDLNADSVDFGMIQNTPKAGWNGINIPRLFSKRYAVPVGFNTDVNAALIGEISVQENRAINRLLYISIGTGIGIAFSNKREVSYVDSHLEGGHMMLPRLDGDNFSGVCPHHGDCWEGMCSGSAIYHRAGSSAANLHVNHSVWNTIIEYTSVAINNLLLILSPEKIIIGGSVKDMGLSKDTVFISKLNALLSIHAKYCNKSLQADIATTGYLKGVAGIFGATIMGKEVLNTNSITTVTKINTSSFQMEDCFKKSEYKFNRFHF